MKDLQKDVNSVALNKSTDTAVIASSRIKEHEKSQAKSAEEV